MDCGILLLPPIPTGLLPVSCAMAEQVRDRKLTWVLDCLRSCTGCFQLKQLRVVDGMC